jgi:hypothetical protein
VRVVALEVLSLIGWIRPADPDMVFERRALVFGR